MNLVWTILIGFATGIVAKFMAFGTGSRGYFLTAALGIAGSLIVTLAGQYLGWYRAGETVGYFGAFIGAAVLLLIYQFTRRD